jgi:1-acyl-sn-glycerol-3-phosphate acyltransferase
LLSRLFFFAQALVFIPVARILWRVRVTGKRFHRPPGGVIIAANHASWLDAPLVQYGVFPVRLTFLMSEVFYDLPILRYYFRAMRARPIRDRSEGRPSVAAIKAALEALQAGAAICIFPEGILSSTGRMAEKGQRGIALLARKTGATVLPMGIRGAVDVYSRAQPRLRLTGNIELHLGEPMTYDEPPTREGEVEFIARLMDRIRGLAGQDDSADGESPDVVIQEPCVEGPHGALAPHATAQPTEEDERGPDPDHGQADVGNEQVKPEG